MNSSDLPSVQEQLLLILYNLPFAFLALLVGKRFHFFSYSPLKKLPIRLYHLVIAAAIYALPFMASRLYQSYFNTPQSEEFFALHCLVVFSIILIGLILFSLPRPSMGNLWNARGYSSLRLLLSFGLGLTAWVLLIPFGLIISQFVSLILELITDYTPHDQDVVIQLKTLVRRNPFSLITLGYISVLVFMAPLVEEILFRGFLYNWIKRHLGWKIALVISSVLFALLHVAAAQGLSNITLVISFSFFALYLGYLYEREGTLFAPYGLHLLFNLVSVIKVLIASP